MKKRSSIYKITNLISNKIYIGVTNYDRPIKRWQKHILISKNKPLYLKNGAFRALHQDMIDLGLSNFVFEVIEECLPSQGFKREKFWIKKTGSFGEAGYNKTAGGRGFNGRSHSKETKQILSELNQGKILGENNPMFGRKHTPEMKAKAAATREKNSFNRGKKNPFFGHKHTEETIAMMKEMAQSRVYEKEWAVKRSKLSTEDVLEIKRLYADGEKVVDLALKFDVSIPCIYKVLKKPRTIDQP